MKKLALSSVLLASFALAGFANAQADETRIRQAHQNLEVQGVAFHPLDFSVSGFPSDLISVQSACLTTPRMTLAQFITSGLVSQVIANSGGQITLRVRIGSAQPCFNGGTVTLERPGAGLVDRDRIVIR